MWILVSLKTVSGVQAKFILIEQKFHLKWYLSIIYIYTYTLSCLQLKLDTKYMYIKKSCLNKLNMCNTICWNYESLSVKSSQVTVTWQYETSISKKQVGYVLGIVNNSCYVTKKKAQQCIWFQRHQLVINTHPKKMVHLMFAIVKHDSQFRCFMLVLVE